MRKVIAISLGFALIVLIAFVLQPKESPKDAASASLVDSYSIAVLNADVLIKSVWDSEFEHIENNIDVRAGTEIKTSAGGRAQILYPDGTITTVEGDSHFVIREFIPSNPSRLSLMATSVWSKLQNIIGSREYFEVETDSASLRDLNFALEYRKQALQATPDQLAALNATAAPSQNATPTATAADQPSPTQVAIAASTPTPTPAPQIIERTITQIDEDEKKETKKNNKGRRQR